METVSRTSRKLAGGKGTCVNLFLGPLSSSNRQLGVTQTRDYDSPGRTEPMAKTHVTKWEVDNSRRNLGCPKYQVPMLLQGGACLCQ